MYLPKINREVVNFATRYNLKIVAGSDAHFRNEIGNAGIETNEEDVRKAILGEIKIFGKNSSIINHAMTKAIKWWGKWR